jgi:6-phosphogluconolactonase
MAIVQKILDIDVPVQKVFERLTDPTRLPEHRCNEEVTRIRLRWPRSLITCTLIVLLLSGLSLLLGPTPHSWAAAQHRADGHVYVLNNDLSGSNSVTVFNREADGSLTLLGTTSIGGLGSLTAFADGTQGSLILSNERTRLFAVDAGSDQISVVNVHGRQLSLVGVFASGGAGPVSLSYHNGLLYVLNAANGRTEAANVAGFHVDDKGTLHPIAGATRPLSAAHPNPAQVQIDPSGRFVLVTEKGTNLIDVYRIDHDGSLSGPTTFQSVGAIPFGMAFDLASPRLEFIVSDAAGGPSNTGAATPYRLVHGTIDAISGPVPDHQIAPCWMVITRDGHFAYTSDADSHAISGYRILNDGTISLLSPDGVTAVTPSDTFPLEEGLSRNSRFLYVLDSRLLLSPPGPATLSGFLIHQDGSLTTVVAADQFTLPFTAIGLAAE